MSTQGLEFAWLVMRSARSPIKVSGDSLPRSTTVRDVFHIEYRLPEKVFFTDVSYYSRTRVGDRRYGSFREFLSVAQNDLERINDTSNGFTGFGGYFLVQRSSIFEFIDELKDAGDVSTARNLELIFVINDDLRSLGLVNTARRYRALRSFALRDTLLRYA